MHTSFKHKKKSHSQAMWSGNEAGKGGKTGEWKTMTYLQFTKVLLCRVKVHHRQVGALCAAHSVGVCLVGRVSCCHGNIHPLF